MNFHVRMQNSWGTESEIERVARTSSQKEEVSLDSRDMLVFFTRLMTENGTYPTAFEFAGATFAMEVPLFVRDHLVRHRLHGFSMIRKPHLKRSRR